MSWKALDQVLIKQYQQTSYFPPTPSGALGVYAFYIQSTYGFPAEALEDRIKQKEKTWMLFATIGWLKAIKQIWFKDD